MGNEKYWINPVQIIDINNMEVPDYTVINLNNREFYKVPSHVITFEQIVDCVETELREIYGGNAK